MHFTQLETLSQHLFGGTEVKLQPGETASSLKAGPAEYETLLSQPLHFTLLCINLLSDAVYCKTVEASLSQP